jgi:hypothetical protein
MRLGEVSKYHLLSYAQASVSEIQIQSYHEYRRTLIDVVWRGPGLSLRLFNFIQSKID